MHDSVKDSYVQLLLAQRTASKSIVEKNKEAIKAQTMRLLKSQQSQSLCVYGVAVFLFRNSAARLAQRKALAYFH
jgi:hypothetical protein